MKVVVLSDTHIPKKSKALPDRLIEELRDAELILHAGDWQTMDVYQELNTYGKVEGVHGNVDGEDIKGKFPDKLIVTVGGCRIGITHGHGKGKTTEKRAIQAFQGENVDCIIFGHSHIPVKKYENGVLLFNPGSPTDKRRQAEYSFGILQINDTLETRHVFFGKKEARESKSLNE